MRPRISIVGLLGLFTACGAAVAAQAGEFPCGWGLVNPYYSMGSPLGFFSFGSHLGLGPGYPGLYPPFPSLLPYFYAPSRPCLATPHRTIVVIPSRPVPIRANGSEHRVVRSDMPAAGTQTTGSYNSIIERARKLYPRGLPPIEQVWTDGQPSRPAEK